MLKGYGAAHYDELAATFGGGIDSVGPDFGIEHLLDTITGSTTLATFVSEQTLLVWPVGQDLRRILWGSVIYRRWSNAPPGA